jgi:AGCS family alanine or glycine:cation symporter
MLGSFIDTIMICTMTGLVIVVTGAWQLGDDSLTGAALTAHAFSGPLGQYGAMIVGFGLSLFAYSTIIAWSYYGDRSAYYLFGERAVLPYRILFTLLVAVGAAVPLNLVWNIADITNILMALPNLLGLILLAGLVNKLKNEYFSRPQTPTR